MEPKLTQKSRKTYLLIDGYIHFRPKRT